MAQQTESQVETVVTIQGLHHSGVPCNDLERAVEFYTKVLGIKPSGGISSNVLERHFTGSSLPEEVRDRLRSPEGEEELREFHEMYQRARPEQPRPGGRFMRVTAGDLQVVLFERLEPAESTEEETLVRDGIFHQSYHISPKDMDRLVELKRQGNSGIRFHSGPALRWPHGRAIYLWDSEGNYLELESEEDLPSMYGAKG